MIRALFLGLAGLLGLASAAAAAPLPQNGSYFKITAVDTRRCAAPYCRGYFVSEVNRARTVCSDGVARASCYVAEIDLAALGLRDWEEGELRQTNAVFFGEIVRRTDVPRLGDLLVGAAWQAPDPGSIAGTMYRVDHNGLFCIAYPCPNIDQQQVNGRQVRVIHDVELDLAPGTDEDRDRAMSAIYSGEGLLVIGRNIVVENAGPAGDAIVLLARRFLPPVTAAEHASRR